LIGKRLDTNPMFELLLAARPVEHDVTIHVSSGTNSLSWFILIFCTVLGLLIALNPSRRTTEIKRVKE
jgi:hypothetical protein